MMRIKNPIKKKYINATEETKVEDQEVKSEETETEEKEESEDMNKGKNWKKILGIGALVTIGVAAAGKKIYDKFAGNGDEDFYEDVDEDEPETGEDTEG